MGIWDILQRKLDLEKVEVSAGVVKFGWNLEKTDKEKLKMLWKCFSRPAFKTPAKWEISISALMYAISDTVSGMGGGVIPIRNFADRSQILGKYDVPKINDFQDAELRKLLEYVSRLLQELYYWLKEEVDKLEQRDEDGDWDKPVYYDNGWRLGMDVKFAESLDQKRKDILDIVNPIFREAGCDQIVLEFVWGGHRLRED